MNSEQKRLQDKEWRKWGPYLSERQWGTVREDYSEQGDAWNYFPHDHARSRVYRWGEDGIAGISDDLQRICFAVSLWNGKDSILKERLFGLTGTEGNHGEDVKELYYYLDNTPSHSYMKHLYKYPMAAFPYADLVQTNRNRSKQEGEYELLDTGLFQNSKYFDVFTEYAKNDPEDLCIRITIHNRSDEPGYIALLPTLWMRNLWSFGIESKSSITRKETRSGVGSADISHPLLGNYYFYFEEPQRALLTENETNTEKLYGQPNKSEFVKDAFHDAVIHSRYDALAGNPAGTKLAPMYEFNLAAQGSVTVKLRLTKESFISNPFDGFDTLFANRIKEADEFYNQISQAKNRRPGADSKTGVRGYVMEQTVF